MPGFARRQAVAAPILLADLMMTIDRPMFAALLEPAVQRSWIQIVFVSVYCSWAIRDLSLPPKPDSL